MITVRELAKRLDEHAADGRRASDEVLILVDGEYRATQTAYSDGAFILVAGAKAA